MEFVYLFVVLAVCKLSSNLTEKTLVSVTDIRGTVVDIVVIIVGSTYIQTFNNSFVMLKRVVQIVTTML
jgi:hypothetical protein